MELDTVQKRVFSNFFPTFAFCPLPPARIL